MELFCTEVQASLQDSRLCSISNSHLYCTTLLKAACQLEQNHDSAGRQSQENSPHTDIDLNLLPSPISSSVPRESVIHQATRLKQKPVDIPGAQGRKSPSFVSSSYPSHRTTTAPMTVPPGRTAVVRRRRSSRDASISSLNGLPVPLAPHPVLGASVGESSLTSWSVITESSLRSWAIISPQKSDSELSGYKADIEGAESNYVEVAESAKELEESHLLSSLISYLVPHAVQQRVWVMKPIWDCIQLLRAGMEGGMSSNWCVCACACACGTIQNDLSFYLCVL